MKIDKLPLQAFKRGLDEILISLDLEQDYGFKTVQEKRQFNKQLSVIIQGFKDFDRLEQSFDKFNGV